MKPVTKYKIIETFIKKINVKEGAQARELSIHLISFCHKYLQYPSFPCNVLFLY
jgi:hypothetical protein